MFFICIVSVDTIFLIGNLKVLVLVVVSSMVEMCSPSASMFFKKLLMSYSAAYLEESGESVYFCSSFN